MLKGKIFKNHIKVFFYYYFFLFFLFLRKFNSNTLLEAMKDVSLIVLYFVCFCLLACLLACFQQVFCFYIFLFFLFQISYLLLHTLFILRFICVDYLLFKNKKYMKSYGLCCAKSFQQYFLFSIVFMFFNLK